MPFQKGHPRFGGRKKGSESLRALCEGKGVNPFVEMLELAMAETDMDKKFYKLKELLPYLHAKPKEDEMDLSKFTPEQIRAYVMGLVENEPKSGA